MNEKYQMTCLFIYTLNKDDLTSQIGMCGALTVLLTVLSADYKCSKN